MYFDNMPTSSMGTLMGGSSSSGSKVRMITYIDNALMGHVVIDDGFGLLKVGEKAIYQRDEESASRHPLARQPFRFSIHSRYAYSNPFSYRCNKCLEAFASTPTLTTGDVNKLCQAPSFAPS